MDLNICSIPVSMNVVCAFIQRQILLHLITGIWCSYVQYIKCKSSSAYKDKDKITRPFVKEKKKSRDLKKKKSLQFGKGFKYSEI